MQVRRVATRKKSTPHPVFLVALSFALFPLGYLLINYEARYLWYMLPLAMLGGGLFIQNYLQNSKYKYLILLFFSVSFLAYPAWGMLTIYDEGVEEYRISEQLRQLHISGTFTSITKPGRESQRIQRIAYFSGCQLYSIPAKEPLQRAVLREMRRYHVRYYFAYNAYDGHRDGKFDPGFVDEEGAAFPEITKGTIRGLRVFLVNP